jgi:signal transduction histidine kinase/DNA-binding response OmpR family regulator
MSTDANSSDEVFARGALIQQPQEAHDILNRYKFPTITICIGVLLAIFVFVLMMNVSMRQLKREFIGDAKLHSTIFKDWLSENIKEIEYAAHFLALENQPTQKIADKIIEPLKKHSIFDDVYWITYDKNSLHIHNAQENNIFSTFLATPSSQKFIFNTLNTKKPALSSPILMPAQNDTLNIELLFPIVRDGKAKEALLTTLNTHTLLEKAFQNQKKFGDSNGYIFDISDPLQEKLIYGQVSHFIESILKPNQSVNSAILEKNAAFYYSETISLPGRDWKILFIPTNKYMSEASVLVPWAMMIACLISSALTGIFLFYLIGQNARTEAIVRERTIELLYTSNQLKIRGQDLKKAKDAAEAANIAKGDFLANMSHEIRTPLNSMLGLTELVLETELTSQQEMYLRTILNSSEDLLEIINDILDFSKIESGKLELDKVSFDLLTALEDTAELFAPKAREKEKSLELLVYFSPEMPRFVMGDPIRIRQILSNLISNAIKFTHEGYILITAEEVKEAPTDKIKIKLSVKDTGIGIPDNKLKIIFEKFSQADVSTTRKFGGTGLGLSICKYLTNIMQGELTVESVYNEGSTFSAIIILEHSLENHADSIIANYSTLKGKKALIIDDLEANRIILSNQLARAGIESVSTNNASEALKMLEGIPPSFDLVVTDYILADRNSEIFTQNIKILYPNLPIIMATALAEKGYAQIFASSGCDAYLTKPIRISQLLDIITMIFEAKKSGKKLSMLTPLTVFRKTDAKIYVDNNKFLESAEILLVEDNKANRSLVIKLLENFGCHATAVRNGEEAIEIAKTQLFDLILMDCQMPEMDGFEASIILCQMKVKNEISDIPIIALTANAMKGDREKCLESGMNDYITKPIRKAALRNILMQWLPPKEKRVGSKQPLYSV